MSIKISSLEIENTKEREAISYGGTNCGCPDILVNVFTVSLKTTIL